MYTFREDPKGIIVIGENGYEIPWGKNGTIPEEAYRLCNLSPELDDDFYDWMNDMTNEERVAEKEDFFDNKKKKPQIAPAKAQVRYTIDIFSTLSANTLYGANIKKEEETMNTIRFEDTQEGKAQVHVLRRANDVYSEKETELLKHYGLRGDDAPRSWNELVKRIKDGKFVISDEHAKIRDYSPTGYVEWRDPKIEKDHEGFEKSMEKLRKLLAETKDVIIVKSSADGLEMIEKIQNFKH
jgi:hypothetical protein